MKFSKIAAGFLLAAPAYVPGIYAQAPTTEELLQRIKELEQQVKVLSRNLELDHEAAAEKTKTPPTVSLGANGLQFRSADSNFVMRVGGHLQVDGRFFPNSHSSTDET